MDFQNNSSQHHRDDESTTSKKTSESSLVNNSGMFLLCVETLQSAVVTEQQQRKQHHHHLVNAPEQAFQHTKRRVALGSRTSQMKRTISKEVDMDVDEDEEEDVSPQRVDDRVERARARRIRLQQRKEEAVANKLAEKLEQAALRRDQLLQERQAAQESADKVRNTRLHQARQRKTIALVKYSLRVSGLLQTFRQSGLHLQGARTTAQVEAVLFDDPYAACAACLKSSPSTPLCPATGRRHPKRLVSCSEEFLTATAELKQIVNPRTKKACSETVSAKSQEGMAFSDDNSSETNLSGGNCDTDRAEKKKKKDPIGLPHFLPLAFHEACGFRACQDEQKLFAARNVVLLLEEIQGATACVMQDFAMLCSAKNSTASPTRLVEDAFKELLEAASSPSASSHTENDDVLATTLSKSSPCCAALLELQSKCEHLRHALNRFVKSWVQFSKLMRVEQAAASDAKTASQKRRTAQQMIRSYVHLTVTEYYRNEDIQRRSDLVNSEDCPSALRNREKWVSERRHELSSAIELQMRDLKKAIEQLGYLQDLEDELAKVNYSTSSTSNGGSPSVTPQKTKRHLAKTMTPESQSDAVATPAGLTTDGISTCTNTPSLSSIATSPQRQRLTSDAYGVTHGLNHVNSADWCDEDLFLNHEGVGESNNTQQQHQEPTSCVLFPSSPPPPAPRKRSLRSSEAFRAQLAADRQRLRRQRQKENRSLRSGGDEADGED